MIRSVRARFVTALILGALWLSAVVAPASAAVTTRWVDNDSHAGNGPAQCDKAKFHTIQEAINASSSFDKVYVCPGNYVEQVTIDVRGLEVRSVPALGARIYPPDAPVEVDGTTDLVRITARDVQLVGFWMKIPAGDLLPDILPSTCLPLDAAVLATAPHATIKANHIKAVGDNSLSGECGYLYGIVIDDGSSGGLGQSLVWRNWIRDFKLGGILVGPDSWSRIYRNAIRYVHLNDPATCVLVPVLGVQPELTFPCSLDLDFKPTQLNGLFSESVGILVEGGRGDLRGNSIYSTLDVLFLGSLDSASLGAGIVMIDVVDGSKLKNNRINNVGFGVIIAEEGIILPPAILAAPDGVQVSGNRVNESFIGFLVLASDGVYYGNRAHLNFLGLLAGDGSGNVFEANDFRYNEEGDCIDATTGAGTLGTANDWEAINWGFENSPEGLCFGGIF